MLIKRFDKLLERVVGALLVAASSFVCKQFINNHEVIHLWNGLDILNMHITVKMLSGVKHSWSFAIVAEAENMEHQTARKM